MIRGSSQEEPSWARRVIHVNPGDIEQTDTDDAALQKRNLRGYDDIVHQGFMGSGLAGKAYNKRHKLLDAYFERSHTKVIEVFPGLGCQNAQEDLLFTDMPARRAIARRHMAASNDASRRALKQVVCL
nr:hypothetical protein CFP56_22298 [Quercus suber]